MRPVDPVTMTLISGEERKFLLTMGGLRRLKARFGVTEIKSILDQDADACGVPILFEALLDKGSLTEEQLADMLPAHIEEIVKTVMRLLGASLPDRPQSPTRPTLQ